MSLSIDELSATDAVAQAELVRRRCAALSGIRGLHGYRFRRSRLRPSYFGLHSPVLEGGLDDVL